MPFYLNLKIILSILAILILVGCLFFFFAFFAILLFPLFLITYLFRKKIFKNIIIKKFQVNTDSYRNEKYESNFYNEYDKTIEVDYESKSEKDLKN